MQSSFMKAPKLRLNAATHSAGLSFSGELGTSPAVASRSVAVDKAEAAELRFRQCPCPRRKISRVVAPTPPASRKPTPKAPTATAGRLARSLAPMLVASPISSRRVSAAPASWSRSDSISRRTSSNVRLLLPAIALQSFRCQPRFADRLLGNRRRPLLDLEHSEHAQREREQKEDPGRDQEGEPRGHGRRERGCDRRECEADDEEEHDCGRDGEGDPQPEREDLPLELHGGELQLQTHDRARTLCDLLDGGAETMSRAAVSPLGGHGLSSRSTSPARCRRRARRRRRSRGSARRSSS